MSFVLAISLLVGIGLQSVFAATIPVSPTVPNGWQAQQVNTASYAFLAGPGIPPAGVGSFEMKTGSGNGANLGGKVYIGTKAYTGTLLSDIVTATIWTNVISAPVAPVSNAPAMQFMVDTDNNWTRNTTLVFEVARSQSSQGAIVLGQWKSSNMMNGVWRTTVNVCGFAPQTDFLLQDFIANCPTARIVDWFPTSPLPEHWGVSITAGQASGGTWANTEMNVDKFIFNDDVIDFEPVAPVTFIVRPSSLQGFEEYVQGSGSTVFKLNNPDPPTAPIPGEGAYYFSAGTGTGAGNGGKTWLGTSQFDSLLLSDLRVLSYWTFNDPTSTAGSSVAMVVEMNLDTDLDLVPDLKLVYEPIYSPQSGVKQNEWQDWNLVSANGTTGLWRTLNSKCGVLREDSGGPPGAGVL